MCVARDELLCAHACLSVTLKHEAAALALGGYAEARRRRVAQVCRCVLGVSTTLNPPPFFVSRSA